MRGKLAAEAIKARKKAPVLEKNDLKLNSVADNQQTGL